MNKKQKIKKILILLSVILIFGVVSVFHTFINPNIERVLYEKLNIVNTHNNLLVHFISIGQGDAIAINLPNDKVVLIDAGPKSSNVSYTNYLDEYVISGKHDKTIDYLILTHADIDHIGGTLRALKNFNIKKLFMPKVASDSSYYKDLENYIENKYEYDFLDAEDVLDVGSCELKVFNTFDYSNTNDSSVVVRLEYMGKSFLFTGDIGSRVEDDLIDLYGDELDSDVLKVSHHGGKGSTSTEFLDYVSPEFAIISVGENYYGHPTEEVLNRLNSMDIITIRTDETGNVLFVVGESIKFDYKTNNYMVTSALVDIRVYSLIIVVVLFLVIIIEIIPKRKKKY